MASKLVRAVALLPTAVFAVSGTAREQSLEAEWSQELNSGKNGESPIKRVVNLIQKMKAELEAEATNEAAMYDKMVCWCETNEKEKTKAIADADAAMIDLQSEIESRSAKVGELAATIENMKKQIAEDTAALKQALAIREKEAAASRGTEKELVQAIANLKNAVAVLKKVQLVQGDASFLQLEAPLLTSLRVVIRDAAAKQADMHANSQGNSFIAIGQKFGVTDVGATLEKNFGAGNDDLPLKFAEEVLAKAANPKGHSFLQASIGTAPAVQSYNSQSNGIFGIMTQMLEEFENDLADKTKGETKAAADYEAMKAAKEEQVAVAKEKLDTLEAEGAGNLKALSDAKENFDLTQKQRSADVKFLRNLKLTCDDLDAQWEKRSKTRAAEIKAVSETLVILTSDDNHEQLKAGGVALFQTSAETSLRARRSRAVKALRRAAQAPSFDADDLLTDWHSRRGAIVSTAGPKAQLSTLAVAVQLDSFTKVKAAMDQLVAEMKKQTEEDVKLKAHCQKEFNQNEKDVFAKTEEKEDHEANLERLGTLMEKLAGEIEAANTQIADTNLEMKKASEGREKENAEFQTVIADQRATQSILKKALGRLEDFYKKGLGKAALAQETSSQTPPVQFNKQKDNAGASPVMSLLDQIIGDSEAMAKEATATEYQAQVDYETMIKDSVDLVKQLSASVVAKTKASAAAKKEAGMAKSDLTSAVGELEDLSAYEADLHGECDFILKNFDIRQTARLQEIEAIQEAKAILSGA